MCEIVNWIIAACLTMIAAKDWKTKQISCEMLLLLGGLVIIGRVFVIRDSVPATVGGIFIGVCLFIISRFTRESIGYGDCWVITLLGIYLGGIKLLQVVLAASVGASLFYVVCFALWRWNRKRAIPFVPFLTAAYLGVMLL